MVLLFKENLIYHKQKAAMIVGLFNVTLEMLDFPNEHSEQLFISLQGYMISYFISLDVIATLSPVSHADIIVCRK